MPSTVPRGLAPPRETMDHRVIDDALSSSSPTQTDYGEDISALILLIAETESTEPDFSTQSASEPPTSTTSLENIQKRKIGEVSDSSNSFSYVQSSKRRKKEGLSSTSNSPTQPYIIAYSETIQMHTNISSGVLFELARLITLNKISHEDVTASHLLSLEGNNVQSASKTVGVLFPDSVIETVQDPAFIKEAATTSPWEELDREEQALAQDRYAGLGHSEIAPGWYGGKIDFRGRLERGDNNSYKIKLDRCTLGPSCRFSRRFGSTSILRIKISDRQILHSSKNDLGNFFHKAFVLWGSVFRAFYAKEGSVFLFKTNEKLVNGEIIASYYPGLSLLDFLNYHNPLDCTENQNQSMSKWAARTALGLSNSVPGPLIEEQNITCQDDIISTSGSDMTDGCGTANRATTLAVSRTVDIETYSVAFQFRLGGLKGMALENSETSSKEPLKVVARPSQIKIRYPSSHHDPLDPTLRIIEILRLSYMRSPAAISAEAIINLADNGVPSHIFVNLLKANLKGVVAVLTTWDGPDAMYNLWTAVERAGAVLHSRRAREAVGEARARGLSSYSNEDDDDDEDDEDGMKYDIGQECSKAWWADQISGCPSSLEETVLVLLDAGFRPQDSPIVREKLKQVVKGAVNNQTCKYRYELAQSAISFVVPDPHNVLGPDEIHVKSSRRNFQMQDDILTDIVLGEVLLTRNPCKLPTDVRKVRAMEHPLLRSYTDVIVCSVQGHRRLLDFLAGGDYDGDTATVIWTPEIVEHFKNADEKYSNEPKTLDICFTSDHNEKVPDFLTRTSSLSPLEKTLAVQTYLLGALRDPSVIGNYSTMHDNAVYHLGYSHPHTIRLAYKFCKVLDSSKTGLTIRPEIFQSDFATYHNSRVPWKEKLDSQKNATSYTSRKVNLPFTRRVKRSQYIKGEFIMDILDNAGRKERNAILADIDKSLFGPLDVVSDPHLTQPWEDATKAAEVGDPRVVQAMQGDLMKIRNHVELVYREYKAYRANKGKGFTNMPIENRQDILRKLSKHFTSYPTPSNMEVHTDTTLISRLRASYAFVFDLQQNARGFTPWSRFPWDLAMRELCLIKANALGPSKTVTTGFYERFKLSRR
ncbi:hypothetical protein E4T56_gene2957 [Termitomyces sp. T112]|nr:hypothetical protein E4T56_gene2957 [Termitomyces sp. T112]